MEEGSGARTIGPQVVLSALARERYLKDGDHVVLHAHYRSARGVGDATTGAGQNLLYRLHKFFVLLEDYTEELAARSITEGDKLLKAVHLPELR